MSPVLRNLLAGALGLLSACRTTIEEVPPLGQKLPFHVAVIPLESARLFELPEREEVTKMRYEPNLQRLSENLVEALRESVFESITLLDPNGLSGPERERAYVRAARAQGADLILRCKFWYHPSIWRQRRGNLYWPDPLLSWVFKDYTYRVAVELFAEVYDPHTLHYAQGVELGDDAARLVYTSVGFRGSPRTNRELGPAAVFIREDAERAEFIRSRVEHALATRLAINVAGKRQDLERFAEDIAPFDVQADTWTIEQIDSQHVRVAGMVHFRENVDPERMSRWTLSAGPSVSTGTFTRGHPIPGGLPAELGYEFDQVLAVQGSPSHVRLELVAGDAELYVRSYTFPIELGAPASAGPLAHQPK